jgi:hypothetical protein
MGGRRRNRRSKWRWIYFSGSGLRAWIGHRPGLKNRVPLSQSIEQAVRTFYVEARHIFKDLPTKTAASGPPFRVQDVT